MVDDANRLLAYERSLGDERAIIAFNASEDPQRPAIEAENGTWRSAFSTAGQADGTTDVTGGALNAELPSLSARVWIRVRGRPDS